METVLFGILFAGIVAYGVFCVADPIRAMRADGTAQPDDEHGASAVRNRRYAGGIVVVGGVLGASYVVGPPGVVACVVAAALVRIRVGTFAETREETAG